jgi:hypothetical protein
LSMLMKNYRDSCLWKTGCFGWVHQSENQRENLEYLENHKDH